MPNRFLLPSALLQSLDSVNSGDSEMISRIKKEIDMKEQFLKRPVPHPTSAEMLDRRRMSTDALPPPPGSTTAVNGKKMGAPRARNKEMLFCKSLAKSWSSGQTLTMRNDLFWPRSLEPALNYAATETLQTPRRATIAQADSSGGGGGVGDLFADVEVAEITSTVRDKTAQEDFLVSTPKSKSRRGSLGERRKSATTNTTTTTDDSESGSRKSSMSSGNQQRQKQFAVTFFVSENDKTKLVDIIHRAKTVIAKKVDKVMGRKAGEKGQAAGQAAAAASAAGSRRSSGQAGQAGQAGKEPTSALAITTILENWVSQEEEKGREEEVEVAELIEDQKAQVDRMVREEGLMDPPIRYIPTVVSPVPEEEEDEDEGADEAKEKPKDDFSVQEVVENEPTLLRPPPSALSARHGHLLSPCSSTAGVLSPRRSLSPADHVPRPAFVDAARRGQEAEYPLRRPSSHYDESAQAASSRPVSPRATAEPESRPTSPLAATRPTSPPAKMAEDCGEFHRTEPYAPSEAPGTTEADVRSLFAMIQRPESMTVPIGGVWRPEEEDEHQEYIKLFFDEEEREAAAAAQREKDATAAVEQGNFESDRPHAITPRARAFTQPCIGSKLQTYSMQCV